MQTSFGYSFIIYLLFCMFYCFKELVLGEVRGPLGGEIFGSVVGLDPLAV